MLNAIFGLASGTNNLPKMTEGGDRVVHKVPAMKKHSEEELQSIAKRASKAIPGAARLVTMTNKHMPLGTA